MDWHVEWEGLLMYGPGNWTHSELQALPAGEFFQHCVLSRRADVVAKHWAINANSFHKQKEIAQRKILSALDEQFHTGTRWRKPTERVDSETRVLIIGSELKVHGDRWARRNASDMEWLASQGITVAEAIARHEAWMEKERAHPFWTPGNKTQRSA